MLSRLFLAMAAVLAGCASGRTGEELRRRGDEIMVCGRLFHTGAPVVLWTDPGGYDAYRVERRFVAIDDAGWEATSKTIREPNRFDTRRPEGVWALGPHELERVRGGGWDLATLRSVVDQLVFHYDVCGTSRTCFRVLHDVRGLSVHFMVDIDGTIYQTLDVKERAWHATTSNHRSVGIEIANMGAYADGEKDPFDRWYARDNRGTMITIPPELGDGGVRTPGFIGRPATDGPVTGAIHGRTLRQYDLTAQQYESLIRLTATLCTVLPSIRCDYPRDERGALVAGTLPRDRLGTYQGLLGHYHIQQNKVDPGPAFDWDRVIAGARRLMGSGPRTSGSTPEGRRSGANPEGS